jgi:uncharacterized metal-binding protein YceD (DUF177 family)
MTVAERPWTVPVAVADIAEAGSHFDLTADAASRDAIARLAGLRELPRLEASFDVERRGEGASVRGEVRADVGQTCVVTLEPIEAHVKEAVDLVYAPAASDGDRSTHRSGADEPPEVLEDGTIDLGAIATEFLILGLDPYPRKAGAAFAAPAEGENAAKPFAALAALKKRS